MKIPSDVVRELCVYDMGIDTGVEAWLVRHEIFNGKEQLLFPQSYAVDQMPGKLDQARELAALELEKAMKERDWSEYDLVPLPLPKGYRDPWAG